MKRSSRMRSAVCSLVQRQCRTGRVGATLVEVLMTLMIMGLGVTSVFTLFPLSVVRSLKASQQTNAALLAHNARELLNGQALPLDADPDSAAVLNGLPGTFWFDPYGDVESGGTTVGNPVTMPRVGLGPISSPVTSLSQIDRKLASPDSWVTLLDGQATVATRSVDFGGSVNLADVGSNSRVIVYSGTTSETRPLDATTVSGGSVSLSGTAPGVPDFSAIGTLRTRIENFERRYTWLLTITSDGNDRFQGECVVFFRRSFHPDDEATYVTDYVYNPATDDPSKSRQITVTMPNTAPAPGRGDRFFGMRQLPGGKYRGTWYRIVSIDSTTSGTDIDYDIVVDKGYDGVSGDSTKNRTMFPRGIVDVFDFGDLHL